MKKVSIVTLAQELSEGLITTLRSVYLQDHPVRHILVDGSSNNLLVQYVSEYFPHTEVLRQEPRGIYPAMNFGLSMVADDDNILFLNSSDFLLGHDCLSKLNTLASSSDTWAYGSVIAFQPQIHSTITLGETFFDSNRFRQGGLLIPHPSTIVPAKWIKALGGFRANFTIVADIDLAFRLYRRHGSPKFLNTLNAGHELGGVSSSNSNRQMIELRLSRFLNFPFITAKVFATKLVSPILNRNSYPSATGELGSSEIRHFRNCEKISPFPYCCRDVLLNA